MHARYGDKLKKRTRRTNHFCRWQGCSGVCKRSKFKVKTNKSSLLSGKRVLGYDTKALVKHLWKHKLDLDYTKVFDIHIASFMVNSLVRDQSLIGLARNYLDLELEAEELEPENCFYMNALSSTNSEKVFTAEFDKPDSVKMKALFYDIETPASIPIFCTYGRRRHFARRRLL